MSSNFVFLKQLISLLALPVIVSCGQMKSNIGEEFHDESPSIQGHRFFVQTESADPIGDIARQEAQKEDSVLEPPKSEAGANTDTNGEAEPVGKDSDSAKKELSGPGVLKPTVYYFPIINEDRISCDQRATLFGAGGKRLLNVCAKTAAACSLQGSCAVVKAGKTHTFNIIGRFDGQDRYFEIEEDGCKYGYGVRSVCLDPFYTLAADLTIYKPGEVIYVPAVEGLALPDGTKHSGYFVIRDQGRGIKGRGRFDFYTGYYSWADPKNPFNKLGLGDVKTNIPYYRVTGETAKQVLSYRAYPELPKKAFAGPKK